VLVGGTGQYIYSIIEGWVIPPGEADLGLRSELEDIVRLEGAPAIFKRLQELDPVAARSIDPRNVRRVIRALEVTLTTGQPFSAQRQKNPPNYRLFMVGLTLARDRLYQRIDQRVEQMLANGLVAEVQTLAAKGYAGSLPAMSAIGYKQIGMYLRNEVSLAEAIRLIKHDTRTFVRRQGNWFKPDDSDIHWYDVQALDLEQLLQTLSLFFAKPPSKASNPSAGPVVHHHL
jgi:tRNA dimethylallyltransferase